MKKLEGKVALVTGAGVGLGRGIAFRLAQEGAAVAVHYHSSAEAAKEVVEKIQNGGGVAWAIQADGRNQEQVRRAVGQSVEHFGNIDVLVNSAGQHRRANSLDQSQADWEDLIARNLSIPFYFAQSAAAHMKTMEGGQIINISSKMAMNAAPLNAAYCAAKAGIIALTQVLASEWARHRIFVNCIAPGVLNTEAMQQMTKVLDKSGVLEQCLLARTPVGRLGEVDDIARVVAFIASGETDFLTGSTIVVDGGWTANGDYIALGLARTLVKQSGQPP